VNDSDGSGNDDQDSDDANEEKPKKKSLVRIISLKSIWLMAYFFVE